MSRYATLEDCTLLRATDRAVCIEYKGERHWLPFSQLAPGEHEKIVLLFDEAEENTRIDGVTISASEWICAEKEIEPE